MTPVYVARIASQALFLLLTHLPEPAEPADAPWRLLTRPCLHIGVRPQADPGDAAVTVQMTYCTPW